MRIYIRHADKLYKNGYVKNETGSNSDPNMGYNYDPGLAQTAHAQCRLIAEALKDYPPDKIVCSPYLRTRLTAVLLCLYSKKSVAETVEVNSEISEYLGNMKDDNLKTGVSESTLEYNPPLYETITDLEHRACEHNKKNLKWDNKITWYVTHGIVMSKIVKYLGYNIKKIKPCSALIVHDSSIEKIDITDLESNEVSHITFQPRRLTDFKLNYQY